MRQMSPGPMYGLLVRTAAFSLSISATASHATVICVDAQATGAGTGQSWTDAFTTIQAALGGASAGDELWIAEGIYSPADELSSFAISSGIALYGGFEGSESLRIQRDWIAHPTILSGDINQDDLFTGWQGSARWYNGWDTVTPNAQRIALAIGCDATTALDGLTFQSARGSDGAGLRIEGGSPVIRNCLFLHNLAGGNGGGGVFCENTAAIIEDCEFIENAAGLTSGGCIAIRGPAMPSIRRCGFTRGNAWGNSSWQGNGGGIEMRVLDGSQPTLAIVECRFSGNRTQNFFQQSEAVRGGAGVWSFGVRLIIDRCVFIDNASNEGAAITSWSSVDLSNSLFIANDATQYPISEVVSGGGQGAGLCLLGPSAPASVITNCTFSRNTADEGAAITSFGTQYLLTNSIVWGNTARGEDIEPLKRQLRGYGQIRYSCVEDLLTQVPGEDPPDPAHFPGCIVIDPQFVNAVGSTAPAFKLAVDSPCIDTGANADVTPAMALDVTGDPRVVRGLPGPGAAIVDQGAFEFALPPPPCLGNANGDSIVDFNDINAVIANWLTPGPDGDANGDGVVNFDDVNAVVANWLSACP